MLADGSDADVLDVANARILDSGHAVDSDDRTHRAEDDGHIPLGVYDGGLHGVIRTAQLISQEGAVLEVVIGFDLAHLPLVRDQQHLHVVVFELLTGDQIEDAGAGLDADRVVDDAGAAALFGHALVQGEVGIQNPQDVGRHAHAEVAVGDVFTVLQLQSALIQEGDELTVQPLQVAVREIGRSFEGELALVLPAGIQALLQPLIFHAGGDHRDLLGHGRHDVGVGEVMNLIGDVGLLLGRQADFDVRTGRHNELLEAVPEAGVNGMGVLLVTHGGIEVDLLDHGVTAQILHGAVLEVQLGAEVGHVHRTVVLDDVEQAGQNIVLGLEVGHGALGEGDLFRLNLLAVDLSIDVSHTDIAVDGEQGILTFQQEVVLDAQLQAVDQGIDHDLGTIHEGNGGIGSQSVDQILGLLVAGGLDGGDNLFDIHSLLIQRPGIEQPMQNGLIRSPHGGSDGGCQGDQIGHRDSCLIQPLAGGHVIVDLAGGVAANKLLALHQAVLEDLGRIGGVLMQHGLEVFVHNASIMLGHGLADGLSQILDLNAAKCSRAYAFVYDRTAAKTFDNVCNVTAFRNAAKQNTHLSYLLSKIVVFNVTRKDGMPGEIR